MKLTKKMKNIFHVVLAAVLVIGLFPAITFTQTESAYAADFSMPSTASLYSNGIVSYSNWNTDDFQTTANGQTNTAYCANPSQATPRNGSYSTTSVTPTYLLDDYQLDAIRAILYYGWGGPGFDASMWPDKYYNGTAMNKNAYIAATHILISDLYARDSEAAMYGCSTSFKQWIYDYIFYTGDRETDTFGNNALKAYDKNPPSADSFIIFQLNTYSGAQTMLSFIYNPNGYAKLKKVSANPSITDDNRCYSRKNAVFTVYDSSGTSVGTLTTDANGDSETIELPVGTYTVKETSAPKGYLKSDEVQTVEVKSGETAVVTWADEPANDDPKVLIGKYDGKKTYYDSGNLPQGSASLAGAEFTVEYYDTVDYDTYDSLKVSGETPKRTWVIRTDENGFANLTSQYFVSGDAFYYDSAGNVILPRGTVYIYETKAPVGYYLNEDAVSFQKIDENWLENLITYNTVKVSEPVYRSDFSFQKKTDDGDRLANIPFVITSRQTGESHIIMTDENGYFSSVSSWNKHSQNTNGNDVAVSGLSEALSQDEDGNYSVDVEKLTLDESKLNNTAGLWFGYNLRQSDDGDYSLTLDNGTTVKAVRDSDIPVKDDSGAMPYDTYELKELRCEANKNYELVATTIVVTRDGICYDFGTIDDVKRQEATITTTAYDPEDRDSYVGVGEIKIVDKVEYYHVNAGEKYTLKGELHDAETGDVITDDNGNAITVTQTFTPEGASGFENIEYTLSTYKLAGKTIVVYEYLYDEQGMLVAKEDKNNNVSQQITIVPPTIQTTALDGYDKDKNVITDAITTIVDTVSYSKLIPGKEYTVTGTLMVKNTDDEGNITEETLLVDGKPVTSEVTFTPETSEGTVDVTFTFDSSAIPQDTALVAFETVEHNGIEIAVHADIEDDEQTTTVYKTKISTTAFDGIDKDKTVVADTVTIVTDEVAYQNALTEQLYTMAGILMDADTGLPILTGDGSTKYTKAQVVAFMNELLDVLGFSADTATASEQSSGDTGSDEKSAAAAESPTESSMDALVTYDGTENTPVDVNMKVLTKLLEENEELLSYMVYETAEFTPEAYNGTVPVSFSFNANDVIDRFAGETKNIVVFEAMFKGSLSDEDSDTATIVAAHADLADEGQTVTLIPSEIGTTATDKTDGDHELLASTESVIVDTVAYSGLIPGNEYTLTATLMDKATGKPLSVKDKQITAEIRFTPNSESGTVDIELGAFDTSSLEGHALVVFEELTKQSVSAEGDLEDVLVAEHKDIDDEGQTVTVTETPEGKTYGKTGGADWPLYLAVGVLVAISGACVYYIYRSYRKRGTDEADGK